MRKLIKLIYAAVALPWVIMPASCISDDLSSSPADRPEFSAESLDFGQVWAGEWSPAVAVTVYNRGSKVMRITDVALSGVSGADVRLNVDGFSGLTFHDVDMRPGDSIAVLADAFPEGKEISGSIVFTVNGAVTSLPIAGEALEPLTLRDMAVTADTRIEAGSLVRVFGCLDVRAGATLVVEEGATLCFHDGASLWVGGKLIVQGTPELQVKLCGDRLGNVVTTIPFDLIPGQWEGIVADGGDIEITCADLLNPVTGLSCGGGAQVRLDNCRLTNASRRVVDVSASDLVAVGCEFSSSPEGVVTLSGGSAEISRCTLADNYLFASSTGALLQLDDGAVASVSESIFYGVCPDLNPSAPDGSSFVRCTFRSNGSDDALFVGCLWGCDPLFDIDAETYSYDYRLKQGSPAETIVCPVRTDRYGVSGTFPGAYNR